MRLITVTQTFTYYLTTKSDLYSYIYETKNNKNPRGQSICIECNSRYLKWIWKWGKQCSLRERENKGGRKLEEQQYATYRLRLPKDFSFTMLRLVRGIILCWWIRFATCLFFIPSLVKDDRESLSWSWIIDVPLTKLWKWYTFFLWESKTSP